MFRDRSGILWMATNGYSLRKYMFESENSIIRAKVLVPADYADRIKASILERLAESNCFSQNGQMLPDNIAPC